MVLQSELPGQLSHLRRTDWGVVDLLTSSGQRAPTPGCAIVMHDFRGQASRVPIESAAYPLRKIHYVVEVIAGWDSNADGIAAREWFDQVLEELPKLSLPVAIQMCLARKKGSEPTTSTNRPAHDCGQ